MTRRHAADRVAIAILAAVAITAAFTFRDYGLGWDDYTHSQYGDLLLKLYGSGFADTRALSFVNLYKYGGGFDMAAALAAKVSPFDLFETRRLAGAVVGIIGLAVTWRTARRIGGPTAGAMALLLIACCPLYYGHMFMNAKDAPFAVAMAVLLLGLVRAFEQYPAPCPATIALTGLGLGLAFGSRILAGVAAPYALAALALIVAAEAQATSWRAALLRLRRFVVAMLPALAGGYVLMALLWPWSVVSPLNPLRAAEYFDTFFERPWREMFAGKLYSVTEMPIGYLPTLFALKLPEIMLALGLVGAAGAFVVALRGDVPVNRRANYLLVALAALFPVALAIVSHPALYNGLRHFVFVVPPFAVLGGLAGGTLIERYASRGRAARLGIAAVIAGALALPLSDMVRLHPYQYTAFNWASGGVKREQDRYMLDYWGLAFKQAGDVLRARFARIGLKPPPGRRWIIEICGPQRPAEVALGPDFETTWERKHADFAMMLGTFYCRDLGAPVLVEIAREGVAYARVYDIRGRDRPELLTEPPP
jgi:hypothetical protein